jgi:hypothetical protein
MQGTSYLDNDLRASGAARQSAATPVKGATVAEFLRQIVVTVAKSAGLARRCAA